MDHHSCLLLLLLVGVSTVVYSASQYSGDNDGSGTANTGGSDIEDTTCVAILRTFPKPDVTYTAKHLQRNCPELCKNSTGHYATGQFPHPWNCNAFINCYNDDAWVHWCQVGLNFNEQNLQCDYPPRSQKCSPPKSAKVLCENGVCLPNAGCRPELCKQPRGQFEIPGDCFRFANCWDSCAYVTDCPAGAGLAFSEATSRCEYARTFPTDHPCYNNVYDNTNATPDTTVPPEPRANIAGADQDI